MTNAETGQRFCIRLYVLVVPNLLMGMFIGTTGNSWLRGMKFKGDGSVEFTFEFEEGAPLVKVKGI